jgi:hypothetical protein
MEMPQIVQPRMRKQLTRTTLAHGHVMRPDHIPDQRRHRVRMHRTAPSGGEYVVITAHPVRSSGEPFFRLAGTLLLQHLNCPVIDADRPRSPPLSRSLDPGTANDRSRAADADLGTGQVYITPAQVEQLAAAAATGTRAWLASATVTPAAARSRIRRAAVDRRVLPSTGSTDALIHRSSSIIVERDLCRQRPFWCIRPTDISDIPSRIPDGRFESSYVP